MVHLVLSGPGKNALSTSVMESAIAAVRGAGDDAIFLTGEGDAFSAGLHLKELASLDEAGLARFLGLIDELVAALYAHPGPTLAWVNGHAVAGGCVLALCCDFRVMTARPGVRFGLNEVALGLLFPPAVFAMARARLPAPIAERVMLEAKLYDADEAKALGLVDVVGEEKEAHALFDRITAHPRDAYAATKRALRPPLVVAEEERRRFLEETVPHWASPRVKDALLATLKR